MRIRSCERDGMFLAEDLATGETVSFLDCNLPVTISGLAFAARLCPLPGGAFITVGPLTPLDDAAIEIAMGFVRKGKGLTNEQRCAAAIYRHALRHGAPQILGLNHFPGAQDDPLLFDAHGSELDLLAHKWSELPEGAEPTPESMARARSVTSVECLLDALASSIAARRSGNSRLASAYSRLASVQIETMQRRAASFGGESAPLDRASAAIDRGIGSKTLPNEVSSLFDDLRRLILATTGASHGKGGEDLARVIQRIKALRAKTIEQGCTEQEALAAANKVAELLDRYGLSLSEIELRRQACEGLGIETDRRRRGAFDACVPSIAHFCDCKVWGEKTAKGALRYVFFGFRADVEAAHFLYKLIDVTFDTETEQFKASSIYADLSSDERRSGINSFQTGLSHGISRKLKAMKAERDVVNRKSSGRDLVPLKTSVIDEELAKLGLSFRATNGNRKKRVWIDAYEAGKIAGYQFEVQAGIAASQAN
jgi:Protein of unknown function (DUF2786)